MAKTKKTSGMAQCTTCGFLKGGIKPLQPCTSKNGTHRFKDLDPSLLASALGKTGGRRPTYKTEQERRAARLKTYANSNAKRRQQPADAKPA